VEFGRDADTGGQTRYVLDLVKHLSLRDDVERIDLVTRQIRDKRVSSDYSEPAEPINRKASIVRLSCGGSSYLPKEKLWPVLDEFTDRLVSFIRKQDRMPQVVHGHYADSGYVAAQISSIFGIPLVFSAHSLGFNKLQFLLGTGMTEDAADQRFAIRTRIRNEERLLARADLVITSTAYEKDTLYGQYRNRELCRYAVIPPGLNLEHFFPYYNYELPGHDIPETQKQAHWRMLHELKRFHYEPEKPVILTLCRPDSRKNMDLLIDVYGQDRELQALANLAVFAGIRDNIAEMEEGERQVLTDMLLQMDRYDLYGKMAIPKNHDPGMDVPEMYRIAALKRGVFVSTSYLETFGLTFIEASASGLPFVATREGGPADIVKNCRSGRLVDIADKESITRAIKTILTDSRVWEDYSSNGINRTREVYTWERHCDTYLEHLSSLRLNESGNLYSVESGLEAIGRRMSRLDSLLIVDIDDTLLGDDRAVDRLGEYLKERNRTMGFGVATGRDLASAQKVLKPYSLPIPDIIISSVGSEITYSVPERYDMGWETHIRREWKPEKIRETLAELPFLVLQEEEEAQRPYKISYRLLPGKPEKETIPAIHHRLSSRRLSYNLIFSHGSFVDILPSRAGKGKAVRYISNKWNIPSDRIITAGNSGNDADMLTGVLKGIVVGNHSPELERLKRTSKVYFASRSYADGILEGLQYYGGLSSGGSTGDFP